ncbi:MAG: SDR family oxidoreductase [Actinobacteria bacterium]|nr:SDR family oxidoreductase [Actinomycetota bacterium]
MDLGLQGRRAAVAAASGGLGFATAAALAGEGARVVICGRDRVRIDEAAARIGNGCIGLVCDVGDAAGGAAFVTAATEALGGLDIVVANSGGPPAGTFESTPTEAYGPAIDLNLLSVVGMARTAIPAMQANHWGRFVAITSISVRQPMANIILSNTARAGATAFLKTVAREVAADGVTVNTVQPGLHATARVEALYGDDLGSLGTLGDPADFGAIVTFLCSDQARFVTGLAMHVDGGSFGGLQ